MPTDTPSLIFIDIETVPVVSAYDQLTPDLQKLWDKKSASLAPDTPPAIFFENRAAIYAEFGKVVAIAMGYIQTNQEGAELLHVKGMACKDEKQLLQDAKTVLDRFSDRQGARLCAHNGKEFDFPYLARRMVIHQLRLPKLLDLAGKKPWEVPHVDTLALWKFGDYKSYTSLELLTTVLNVTSSKKELDGSQVGYYFYNLEDLQSICQYCMDDVVATVQVYRRMMLQPLIAKKHIIRTITVEGATIP